MTSEVIVFWKLESSFIIGDVLKFSQKYLYINIKNILYVQELHQRKKNKKSNINISVKLDIRAFKQTSVNVDNMNTYKKV